MTMPRNFDASFIVRDSARKPIGTVIVERGASEKFSAWSRDGKIGEFATSADAIDAVRQAHFKQKQEEKRE